MNKPLRAVAIFCGLLVLGLLIRANWLQYVRAPELASDTKNRRVQIEQFATARGGHHRGWPGDHRLHRDRGHRPQVQAHLRRRADVRAGDGVRVAGPGHDAAGEDLRRHSDRQGRPAGLPAVRRRRQR
ncbi:hypothetical protein LV779_38365 [Streptomyces thinghirensis]|nr:hypothetical protein [Streptomyces thinghirensis]